MDLSFFRRVERNTANRRAARLDYGVLIATLQAHQLVSPAARAEGRRGVSEPPRTAHQQECLIEILTGGAGWREAVLAQQGAFNPTFAAQLGVGRKYK